MILSEKAVKQSRYVRSEMSAEINSLKKDIDKLLEYKKYPYIERNYIACAIRDRRREISDIKDKMRRYYGCE